MTKLPLLLTRPDVLSVATRDALLLLFTESPDQLGPATAGFMRAHACTISSIDVGRSRCGL